MIHSFSSYISFSQNTHTLISHSFIHFLFLLFTRQIVPRNPLLEAKRSFAQSKSAIIRSKRSIQMVDRQSFRRPNKNQRSSKCPVNKLPKITPQQRLQIVSPTNYDFLDLDEPVDVQRKGPFIATINTQTAQKRRNATSRTRSNSTKLC